MLEKHPDEVLEYSVGNKGEYVALNVRLCFLIGANTL